MALLPPWTQPGLCLPALTQGHALPLLGYEYGWWKVWLCSLWHHRVGHNDGCPLLDWPCQSTFTNWLCRGSHPSWIQVLNTYQYEAAAPWRLYVHDGSSQWTFHRLAGGRTKLQVGCMYSGSPGTSEGVHSPRESPALTRKHEGRVTHNREKKSKSVYHLAPTFNGTFFLLFWTRCPIFHFALSPLMIQLALLVNCVLWANLTFLSIFLWVWNEDKWDFPSLITGIF